MAHFLLLRGEGKGRVLPLSLKVIRIKNKKRIRIRLYTLSYIKSYVHSMEEELFSVSSKRNISTINTCDNLLV